jgi:Holliday junction resolvasome RuvABC endonuclease subunit
VIVLGLDPSLCNLGLAAVDLRPDGERVLETLVIRTEPSQKKRRVLVAEDDARRVAELAAGLDAAIERHRPAALVIEAPAGSKHAKSARALGLAFGAMVAVAKLRALPLVQVQPLDVKRAVCGAKQASKDEIVVAVERRFPEVEWPTPASVVEHAADAIGAVLAALDTDTLRMARRLGAPRRDPEAGPP